MTELLETLQTKVELVKRNVGTCVFTVELTLLQFQFSMKYHQVNFLKLKQQKKAQTLSELGQISAIHSIPVFHAGNQDQMVLSMSFESGY